MAASLIGQNPNLQVVSITDFTPGVHQFGRGGYATTYSSTMPVGSASLAFRCIGQANVGLVPFYGYSVVHTFNASSGNSPGGHPYTAEINSGFGILSSAVGPTSAGALALQSEVVDYMVLTVLNTDSSGAMYSVGSSLCSSNAVALFDTAAALWGAQAVTEPSITSFASTSQFLGGVDVAPYPMLVFTNGNVLSTAAPGSPIPYVAPVNNGVGFGAVEWQPLQTTGFFIPTHPDRVIAHSGRVFVLNDTQIPIQGKAQLLSAQTWLYFTDPPFTASNITPAVFNNTPNFYAMEEPSGIGAWGSVSTGELILINRGGGAEVVSGDAAFPSYINRLPAIPGTGQSTQHMAACSVGLLYVTETDGVWAWNGGNTATKVSSQLPDTAFNIASLLAGGFNPDGFSMKGPRVQAAMFKDRVFFPHNWVVDAQTGSWWQCEDPAVADISFWAASGAYTGRMYGQSMGVLAPGAVNNTYAFNPATSATSYRWVSNPIPSGMTGGLPTLSEVEICATNPNNQPATIKITPTVVAGSSSFGNNPQSVTFTIPASTYGYRASQALGYSEQNLCVQVDAAGAANQPAPVLHEIHLGFSIARPSGV